MNALKTLGFPGETARWKTFCDYVRAECGVTENTRGYGDRSIRRVTTEIKGGHDK